MDQPIGFIQMVKETKCAISKGLYVVLSNLLDHGTLDSMKPLLRLA